MNVIHSPHRSLDALLRQPFRRRAPNPSCLLFTCPVPIHTCRRHSPAPARCATPRSQPRRRFASPSHRCTPGPALPRCRLRLALPARAPLRARSSNREGGTCSALPSAHPTRRCGPERPYYAAVGTLEGDPIGCGTWDAFHSFHGGASGQRQHSGSGGMW
ncbi:hypothetical protein BS78_K003900 [Paspalum vaginatum]|uniref:Uncharacterized protein n=1 Tax=Paspalum vaginatum TaxID=158149 RepID=A0A9W7XCG6_9POAL|nr:hypothetical protein BS78_K003900 [Paspalum vaginatum]